MSDKLIIVNSKNCTGCRICELACSYYHYKIFNPSASRIYIKKEEHQGIDKPLICNHCENPICVKVCLVNAFYKTRAGVLVIDEEKCTSCKKCIEACPYNAIRISPYTKKAIMCDLCGMDPQCVEWCPSSVLIFKYKSIKTLKEKLTNN